MSSSAQTMIIMATVPAMMGYAAYEARAAIASLRSAAADRIGDQAVEFRILAENAITSVARSNEAPAPVLPEQWRIAA